jgi:histidinol-phosphate aminotransferase
MGIIGRLKCLIHKTARSRQEGRHIVLTRRYLLKASGLAFSGSLLPVTALSPFAESDSQALIHLNLNENSLGPSPSALSAIQLGLPFLSRYADTASAQAFTEQIAAHERVPVEQVVLGEILGALGLYLGSLGGPGGEFIFSTPGYLALIDAASRVGGIGIPVPLNSKYENDLAALAAKVNSKTRALYLINPHNPTGTASDSATFKRFLSQVSQHAPVIVDEAYLEYTVDFEDRSATSLVREGANVLVFRTFDKIHGLAGLPIGYTLAPRPVADALHTQGLGDAESLGRLNIAAASAALADTAHVRQTRSIIAAERARWATVLDEMKLSHTDSQTNFIFFDAGRPQPELATDFRAKGIVIGRTFPPYTNWSRITIGQPTENRLAQQRLREILRNLPA